MFRAAHPGLNGTPCKCLCCTPPVPVVCRDQSVYANTYETMPSFEVVTLEAGATITNHSVSHINIGHEPGAIGVNLDVNAQQDKWFAGLAVFPDSPYVTIDPQTVAPDNQALIQIMQRFNIRNAGDRRTQLYLHHLSDDYLDAPFVYTGLAFESDSTLYLAVNSPMLTFDRCWRGNASSVTDGNYAQVLSLTDEGLLDELGYWLSCVDGAAITKVGFVLALSTTQRGNNSVERPFQGDLEFRAEMDNHCIEPVFADDCRCSYTEYASLNLALTITAYETGTPTVVDDVDVTLTKVIDATDRQYPIRFSGSFTTSTGCTASVIWYPCDTLSIALVDGDCDDCESAGFGPPVFTFATGNPNDGSDLSHDPPNVGFSGLVQWVHSLVCLIPTSNPCGCGYAYMTTCGYDGGFTGPTYYQFNGDLTP